MRYNYSRIGCKGIVYDGEDLTQYFELVGFSTGLLPSLTATAQELAQLPGAYFANLKVGTRAIDMKFKAVIESRDPLEIYRQLRELTHLFLKDEPKKLQLDEDRYCLALPTGETPIEDVAYTGVFPVTFTCFDPFFYGAEHEVAVSGTKAFDVQCRMPVYPVFELTASSSTVKVTNQVTGEFVSVPDLTSGVAVTIDMERRLATANGSFAPVTLMSSFFSVRDNAQVKVEGASGTLKYRERYI